MAALVLAALVFGNWLAQYAQDPSFVLTAVALAVIAPFVWHNPRLGLYLLLGGAAAIETFRLRFPDSVTDVIPFFRTLESLGSPLPAPVSPAELIALGAVGIIALKRLTDRMSPIETGPLFPPLAMLMLLATIGFVRGIAAGGDMSAALLEWRSQFYLVVAFLLAYNLIREPRHARVLLWVLLGAIALKGMVGMWRLLVTLEGNPGRAGSLSPNTNAMFSHEESFFFAVLLMFFGCMFLFRTGKAQRLFCLVFMLPVLVSLLANERRAGIAILLIGMAVIAVMVFALEKSRRRLIIRSAVALLLITPVYLVAFAGGDGMLAQPARAVISVFQPDERDLSSNVYRVIEYENLRLTILESPIIGKGYGRPFTMYEPLPDISDHFTFWDIIPHNNLLWLWLRLGIIGVIVFWFFIGRTIVTAGLAARATQDPYMRALAVLAVAVVVGWLVMGKLDMGLVNTRLAILVGVFGGIVARMYVSATATHTEERLARGRS